MYEITFDVTRVSTYKVVVEADSEEQADEVFTSEGFNWDDVETVYFSEEKDCENTEIIETVEVK